jgi:hypothetical protein
VHLGDKEVSVSQKTNYPWDGKVELSVNPESATKFTLKIRIPGWALNEAIPGGLYKFSTDNYENVKILVNGENTEMIIQNGYAEINKKWKKEDKVEVHFPMPVRTVTSYEGIMENIGKIAFQRGPVIFCAEWPDNNTGNLLNFVVNKNKALTTEFIPALLNGVQVIKTSGSQTKKTIKGKIELLPEESITLIPYAFWNNRGPGQMMVWLPTSPERAHPLPAPTIAYKSRVRSSKMTKALASVNDQVEPRSSNDSSVEYYHWFPNKNQWEWVEYDFEKPETISRSKVYWFDDGPDGGCRIPDEWEILYLTDNIWKSAKTKTSYVVSKDKWNTISFEPVKASAVKIKVKLNKDFSGGIHEWIIE